MKRLLKNARAFSILILAVSFLGCEKEENIKLPDVVAGFTFTVNQTTGTVVFINISEEATSYEWDFGDGQTSTLVNPVKTYENGTYSVTLTAFNEAGANSTIENDVTVTIDEEVPEFDSGLLTNGDFENGVEPWIGNGANVVTEGGNSFNLVNVETAGNPFDVNLSQVVEITQGTNYILTFEASSDRERTILAGIGLNEDPFTSTASSVSLTTETQTFTLQLSAADFGGANSRVLFDMGAEVGVVVIDNVSLVEGGDGSDSGGGEPPFDSGLLTNGDFEDGVEPWIGNGANVVTEGGNSFNSVDVTAAGNPFDVNLSQVVEITQGTNYILTFEASSDRERTMLAGIGLNEAPFTNTAPTVNLTTETQTFTLQLSAADFGGANSRVLFDMGAEVGVVVIDNVSLVEGGDGSDSGGGEPPFDSGLLTNGDFEDGGTAWIGNGLNVVTEGGNSFNSVDVTAAGNPFDVNLSQVVEITQGTNYILTFEASSDRNRTILAGIGLNEAPFTNTAPPVNLTTETQTFTLQLSAADFGGANSRVLFDMGAEVGVVVIDNVSLVIDESGGGGTGCESAPVAATALPLDFEGCETFPPDQNFGAGLTSGFAANPSKTGINTSDFVWQVDKPTGSDFFAGIQNVFPSNFDLTTTDTFKIKIYSTKANVVFRFELLANPNDGSIGNPAPVFVTVPNANEWTEVEVTFTGLPAGPTAYSQLVIKPDNDQVDSPITNGGTYYLDDLVLE